MPILNPDDFTIAPGDMRSLQDRLLEMRRSLPESLRGPEVGGQPQQTQPEQQQMQIGQMISQNVRQLSQQTDIQPEGQPTSLVDEIAGLRKGQKKPTKPESYGGAGIGSFLFGEDKGGIFGTGIQPVDVLAFALGSAITSRMPQDKAIATTMAMAKMPSQFRDHMKESEDKFVQSQIQLINAQIGASNAEVAATKSAQAKQEFDAGMKLADAIAPVDPGKAMAFRANRVTDYEKLTGDTSKAPASLMQHIEGIASGSVPPPPWFMNMTGAKSPREAQAAAGAWLETHMLNQAPIPQPSGGAVIRTPQGPQIINEAPVASRARGLQDIQRDLELQRRGVAVQQQAPMAPRSPAAIPPLAAPAAPAQPVAPAGLPIDQLLNSSNPRDQWTGKYAGDMLPQTQSTMGALFQKPLDASVRQKLVAQKAAIEYSEDLLNKYNAMVNSYGGEGKFKFSDQMKQWMVTQGSRISGEGLSGAVLSTAADLARRGAQEFGRPFTNEAHDFMAMYNQAQKFARGAMNDAANLATRERDMFAGMLGKPLDKPAFFRATLLSFHDEIAREYNDNLAANKLNRMEGLTPIAPLRGSKPAPTWFKPLNQEQAPVQPGGEY